MSVGEEQSVVAGIHLSDSVRARNAGLMDWVDSFRPPKYLWRTLAALVLGGEVMVRILQGECVSVGCMLAGTNLFSAHLGPPQQQACLMAR